MYVCARVCAISYIAMIVSIVCDYYLRKHEQFYNWTYDVNKISNYIDIDFGIPIHYGNDGFNTIAQY